MEKERKSITQTEFWKEAKRYINKKTALAIFTFLIFLVLAVLSSIPEFQLNPQEIATQKFWTKMIMSLIISATSLVCFIIIGQSSNASVQASDIYIARRDFKVSVEGIINGENEKLNAFDQRINTKFHPKAQEERIREDLNAVGLTDRRYLKLTKQELAECLKNPIEIAGKEYLDTISKKQYEVLLGIKEGRSNIKFPKYNDYLYEKSITVGKTVPEAIANQFKKRNAIMYSVAGRRMLSIIVFSVVFAMIGWSTVEIIGEDMSNAQRTFSIVWDIISKLATAISSAFIGFTEGKKFNDFDASYLQLKIQVHKAFENDRDFVPKTANELAHEKFVESKKKEVEKQNIEYAKQIGLTDSNLPIEL